MVAVGGAEERRNCPKESVTAEHGDDPAAAGTDALRAIWREHARSAARTHTLHRVAGDAFWPVRGSATVVPTVVNRACRPRRSVCVRARVWAAVVLIIFAITTAHTRHDTCGAPVTMKKHSKQLEKRIEEQRQQRLPGPAGSDRRRSSKCKNGILKNESSPELSRPATRKSRQYFLEPIRRWNSFHNSRERKSTAAAVASSSAGATTPASPSSTSSSSASNLPYLQTLVNLQRESKSACARFAQSVLPKMPRGAESAPVLGATGGAAATTQSPSAHQQTAAGSPAKKQNSSPNLLLVYDRRQQGAAGGTGSGGNSLTNSPRRSARRPKTPPPVHHHQQQQLTTANSSSCGTDAAGSSKIPFAIIVGDTPIVCKDAVPRIKAIRADSVSEKSSSSYLAVDLSPHRRYSFWSVNSCKVYTLSEH